MVVGRTDGWVGQVGRSARWVRRVGQVGFVWLCPKGAEFKTTIQYDSGRYRTAGTTEKSLGAIQVEDKYLPMFMFDSLLIGQHLTVFLVKIKYHKKSLIRLVFGFLSDFSSKANRETVTLSALVSQRSIMRM